MKRWFPLCVLFFACAVIANGATVQDLYTAGMRASLAGDDTTARKLFVQVLAADPGNRGAAAMIKRIDLASTTGEGLKARVEKMNVSKVDFTDASLTSVLDYLPKLAAQQSGAAPLNIVRMFPKEYGDEKKITLQLSGVPMATVLDYVAQLGGLTVKYDRSAVVIRQAETAATAAQ